MNPFSKTITFSEKKPNHFYCIKENDTYLKVDNPKKGDIVYEVPTISGGEETKKLLLEIPIPLCQEHQHNGIPFGVKTCNNWEYIAIPRPLGSLMCRECNNELFIPQPYLRSADLPSDVSACMESSILPGASDTESLIWQPDCAHGLAGSRWQSPANRRAATDC